MIDATLEELRLHIEELANETGDYYLVCARHGIRPDPVSDRRFTGRTVARAAAHATKQYRQLLRLSDPQLPYCDIIVCQDTETAEQTVRWIDRPAQDPAEWTLSEPVLES